MSPLEIPVDDGVGYRRLRCPRCGNQGASSFSTTTFVLIRGDGVPFLVGDYTELAFSIECYACDYEGPLEAFTQRHRPADARHPWHSSPPDPHTMATS